MPQPVASCADPEREGQGVQSPSEKSQSYRVPEQYWLRSPENRKGNATKLAFNVGPISAQPVKRNLDGVLLVG